LVSLAQDLGMKHSNTERRNISTQDSSCQSANVEAAIGFLKNNKVKLVVTVGNKFLGLQSNSRPAE